jgi:hypothetical protein
MTQNTTDRPWPRVTWDQPTLDLVAKAVRRINPTVHHETDESAASYIRGTAERELYRLAPDHGTMISTGGWQVTFIAGDRPHEFSAWPALTPYTVLKFAGEQTSS